MVRRKRLELGIVTLVLVLTNCAESKETCSHRCDAPYGQHQLNYKERTTYAYEFSSELNLNLPKARDLKATTQVKATVFVTPHNRCGYVLKLQNFRIIGATGKSYENFVGIEKPVTFQYLDGAVGPEICAETDDPSQSLNVKRAIISHLQLDSKGPQTDVFGVCPTNSVVEKDNGDTVVRKTRNLNNCDKRENLEQNFMADMLRDKRILKSVPILNSNFQSVHRVNGGIVKHANIFEQYVAMVSSMDNEANATVRSVLQYVGTVAEMKSNLRTTETKSIIFDGIPSLLHKSTTDVIIATLNKFGLDRFAMSNTTAQNFLSLVKIMRESLKDDLISVYKMIEDTYFRKIFLDALLRCGTSDALTAAVELKTGNELHRSEEELLYQGFAYIRYPTPEIIRVAANLLNNNHVPKEAYPSIGSLVARYCDQRTCPDNVVSEITTKFASKLASPSKTEAVYALKALSNAKHLPEKVGHQVFAVAQNPHQHVRLRSAAYDVLTSIACFPDIRNGLIDVLQNTEEDSEIRIKSYLVLAKCPDQYIATVIETLVNSESSYQVGGFIASHAKSSKNILSTIDIQKTYPQDPRKYSFMTEIPHNFAGFSGTTGAEVIYSQKSFLPRFAKINVTADMFGSSINVFELEMRQENVDRMLEHFMGPVGVYKKDVYHNAPPNIDLDVDVSMKLFGSDLLFTSFSEKPLPFMNRMLEALSENVKSKINFELNKQNGMIFIDSQLSYPTSTGFPLRLSVEGVASTQMRVEDDFNRLYSKYGLIPSIDLDLVTGIAMDAVVVETGVKVISKVHVAAGFVVNIQQGEIKFSLPVEQQEASISHDIYINQREFGEPDSIKPVQFPMNEEEVECLEGFAAYTGLDLCVRFNAPPPNNNRYLGGKYKAALMLKNIDFSHLSLSHRFFPKRSTNEENITELSVKILGQRENIKTGAILDLSRTQGYMARATATLPNQNASAEVRYTNLPTEKSIFAHISFDKQKFFAKLGVGISRKPHKLIYSPLVYIAIPGKNGQQHYPINTKGSLVFATKSHDLKVVLDNLQLILRINPKVNIYSANGSFGQDRNGFTLDLNVSDGNLVIQTSEKIRMSNGKFKFFGHLTNNKYPELNLHVNYDFMRTRSRLRNLLEAVHGSDRNSTIRRLIIRNDAYFDVNNRIFKLTDEIKYPHGEFFAATDFERSDKSFALTAKLKTGPNLYGGNIKSNYERTLLGETRMVLYSGDQKIETSLVHSQEKIHPVIGYYIHNVEFTFKSPQTDTIYVNGIYGDTPPKMIYGLQIKDTSRKYVDLSFSRIEKTYNLVMYIMDKWDIVARVENKRTETKADFLAKVFGNNAKFDVFANVTPSSYYVGSSTPTDFLLRSSLILNGISYGNVNVSYSKHTDHKKLIAVHRLSLNTSDIIRSGVRDDLQINSETHSAMVDGAKSEIGAVYTGYYGEYNFKWMASMIYPGTNNDVILRFETKVYPKNNEAEGITVEATRHISDSEMWSFKIDALNHEEKLFVGVGYDRRGGVNVTSEVHTNLVFDSLKANFSTVISVRPSVKVLVKAGAMTKHCEHKLSGEFKEVEKGGELLVTLTNNHTPPITLTGNYAFKPQNLEIIWDLRRGTSTLSTALITIGENRRREYVVNAQGTYDERTFAANLVINRFKFDNTLEISVDDEQVILGRVALNTYFNMLLVELKHRNSEHILIQLDAIDTGKLKVRLDFASFNSEGVWSIEDLHKFNVYVIIENVIKLSLNNVESRLPHHSTDHIKYEVSINNANLISGSTKVSVSDVGTYNISSKLLLRNTTHVLQTIFSQEGETLGFIQKYCDEKKPCLEINAHHAVNKNSLLLNLRYHKMYIEQASMNRNHSVEVVFDDRTKYAARVLEVQNGFEYSLSMPRRLMVLDLRYNSSRSLLSLNYDFYPNKLQSLHKTTLSMACKMAPIENKCELILADPNLSRNLMIGTTIKNDNNGNQLLIYVFDIFKRDQDKIVLEVRRTQDRHAYSESRKIMSRGLDFSCEYVTKVKLLKDGFEYVYDTKIQLEKKTYVNGLVTKVLPNEMLFNLTAFNNQVFMLQARRFGSPLKTIVEADLELIGVAPMYGRLATKNFASLNFTTGFKNRLDKFEFAAKLFGGDIMRAQATKNNTVLFTTSLSMKGNVLDFDYRYNASNVDKLVLKPSKKVLTQSQLVFETLLKHVPLTDDINQVRRRLHATIPDFANYLNFYLKEKNNLKHELSSEPAFRPLHLILSNIIETGYYYADVIANRTYDDIGTYVSAYLLSDFETMINNVRLSRLLEDELFAQLVDFNYFLGAHEKDVREFGVDFFARVDEALALLHVIKHSFLEAYRKFKDTAIWVKLSNRLDRGPPASPELIRHYKKIVDELRLSTNSFEMIKLLDLLEAYTEKKLLKKYVDDAEALEEINEALEDVLLSIYNEDSSSWQTLILLFKVSLLELQMSYERIGLVKLNLDEIRTTAAEEVEKLNFPQVFTGVFAPDYIFTFDNNHLTMNTNCELLLLEDAIDGNFSITVDYTRGYARFTFEDKKNQIKLFKNGWDVPKKFTETDAYALHVSPNSNQILIKSKYGAQLDCDLSVLTCVVKVSGYYHNHLKGLLGNANREAYDDVLTNGKIPSNSKSHTPIQCTTLQTPTNAPSNEKCEQLFSEPTFRFCSKFVDPEPYKKACDESYHIGLPETEEKIVQVYGAICDDQGIQIKETNFIL